jgi:hypothetical protein
MAADVERGAAVASIAGVRRIASIAPFAYEATRKRTLAR